MLTKAIKTELATTLTVKGQGDEFKFDITYNNCTEDELDVVRNDPEKTVADVLMAMVKDWDSEYELSLEGLSEMESARPGMVQVLIDGYNQARRVAKVKN